METLLEIGETCLIVSAVDYFNPVSKNVAKVIPNGSEYLKSEYFSKTKKRHTGGEFSSLIIFLIGIPLRNDCNYIFLWRTY